FQNELYDRSDGRDPITHPATQKEAELYSRYYIRFEGSFNRAYKQLKDSQTNRICRLIEAHPEAPRPSLPLADALKIQRFAKRTPPPSTSPETEPRPQGPEKNPLRAIRGCIRGCVSYHKQAPNGVTEPRCVVLLFSVPKKAPRHATTSSPTSPSVAAEIRDDAANLDISVNFLISQYAKIGYQTALEESVRNEPNLRLH
ncbi:MAG: hypothetical protein IT168_11755, partial [Bryobacterales bacterium]|nr:hypothetical protein [Bryobacterales bacterium]